MRVAVTATGFRTRLTTVFRLWRAPAPQAKPFTIVTGQKPDGRWIADLSELPGIVVSGATRDEAILKAKKLALHELADLVARGKPVAVTFSLTSR